MQLKINKKTAVIGGIILACVIVFVWVGVFLYNRSVERYDALQVAEKQLEDLRLQSEEKEKTLKDEITNLNTDKKTALANYEAEKNKLIKQIEQFNNTPQITFDINSLKTLDDCKNKLEFTQRALQECRQLTSQSKSTIKAADEVIVLQEQVIEKHNLASEESGKQNTLLQAENSKLNEMLGRPRGGIIGYLKKHFCICVGGFAGMTSTGRPAAGFGVMLGWKI